MITFSRVYIAASVIAALAFGCGGADPSSPPELEGQQGHAGPFAIKVLVGEGDARRIVVLPPVPEVSDPGEPMETRGGYVPGELFHAGTPAYQLGSGWYGNGLVTPIFIPDLGGWNLVTAALIECGANTKDQAGVASGFAPSLATPTTSIWRETRNAWFAFGEKTDSDGRADFDSCTDQLVHAELLVCAADKLLEVTEAVAGVTWENVRHAPSDVLSSALEKPWVIPPQRGADEFVARDLAIGALAHVGRLLVETPLAAGFGSCVEAFSSAMENPSDWLPDATGAYANDPWLLFGARVGGRPNGYLGPWDTPTVDSTGAVTRQNAVVVSEGTIPSIANERLEYLTHIVRAAGRTLDRAVRANVEGDLAAAYEQAGKAEDVETGQKLFWGLAEIQKGAPYASIGHALRTLFSRWEVTAAGGADGADDVAPPPNKDPRCGGFAALTAIQDGVLSHSAPGEATGLLARVTDRSLAKEGTVVEELGLLIADHQNKSDDELQAIVIEELQVAASIDPSTASPDELSPDAQPLQPGGRIHRTVTSIPIQDIRRALLRNESTVQLHAGYNDGFSFNAIDAGLIEKNSGLVLHPSFSGRLGVYRVRGGLKRGDVSRDVWGELGPLQANAECPSDADWVPEKRWAFQDAFALGGTFAEILRDVVEHGVPNSLDARGTLAAVANASLAELRTWAGPGRVTFDSSGSIVSVKLTGISAQDLGLDSTEALHSRVALVYGDAWQADCVAGLRTRCNTLEPTAAVVPQNITTSVLPDGRFETAFSVSLSALESSMENRDDALSRVYVVVRGADDVGAVVAAFPFDVGIVFVEMEFGPWKFRFPITRALNAGRHDAVFSPLQRHLANQVFGISADSSISAAGIAGYCIEGMPNDAFVPLENELTSDGDEFESSWRRYLNLARNAAVGADSIGKEIIEFGFRRDQRSEGAREELGERCGIDAAAQPVDIANGKVGAAVDDSDLDYCMNEPTYDIVFLTASPWAGLSDSVVAEKAWNWARCDPEVDDPTDEQLEAHLAKMETSSVCRKIQKYWDAECDARPSQTDCDDLTLSVRGLTSAPHPSQGDYSVGADAPEWNCGEIVDAIDTMAWDQLSNFAKQPYMDREALIDAVRALNMISYSYGAASGALPNYDALDWTLLSDQLPILATNWPVSTEGKLGEPPPERQEAPFPACKLQADSDCLSVSRLVDGKLPSQYEWVTLAERIFRADLDDAPTAKAALRRQVEGAIWTLGAIAGKLPAGAIQTAVPVAAPFSDSESFYPATTVYSAREIDTRPNTIASDGPQAWGFALGRAQWTERDYTHDDEDRIGLLFPIPRSYASAELEADDFGPTLPEWLADVYFDVQEENAEFFWSPTINRERLFPESPRNILPEFVRQLNEDRATAASRFLSQLKYPDKELGEACKIGSAAKTKLAILQYVWEHRQAAYGSTADETFNWDDRLPPPESDGGYADARDWVSGSGGTVLRDVFNYNWHLADLSDDDGSDGVRICEGEDDDYEAEHHRFVEQWNVPISEYFGDSGTRSGYLRPHAWLAHALPNQPGKCAISSGGAQAVPLLDLACLRDVRVDQGGYWVRGDGTHDGYMTFGDSENCDDRRYQRKTGSVLLPSTCSPQQRSDYFVNAHYPMSSDAAFREVAQAMALACLVGKHGTPMRAAYDRLDDLPPIQEARDIAKLEAWLERQRGLVERYIGELVLTDAPRRAVDSQLSGDAGSSGRYPGEHGQLVLQYGQRLSEIAISLISLHDLIRSVRDEVQTARYALMDIDIQRDGQMLRLELMRIQSAAQRAKAIIGMVHGAALVTIGAFETAAGMASEGGGPLGGLKTVAQGAAMIADGGVDLHTASETEENADAQGDNVDEAAENGINRTIHGVVSTVESHLTELKKSMEGLRSAALSAQTISMNLQDSQNQATYAAAKMANADYYRTAEDTVLKMPVNTVLRRQYDAYQIRYDNALRHAKRLAYTARLAIEQKLGVRLADLNEPVGALEAPRAWVDDVCTLTGIDYETLRNFVTDDEVPTDGEAGSSGSEDDAGTGVGADGLTEEERDRAVIESFANAFIGDYVDKLELFVEYYNGEFPSQVSDDRAALSLRDDLLGNSGHCVTEARNLLHFSDDLTSAYSLSDGGYVGWSGTGCTSVGCTVDENGIPHMGLESLPDGSKVPIPFPPCKSGRCLVVEDGSWMLGFSVDGDQLFPNTPPMGRGGIALLWDRMDDPTGTPERSQWDAMPPRAGVSQAVDLNPGRYSLSWWDMAVPNAVFEAHLDPTGELEYAAPSQHADYRVWIIGPDERPVLAPKFTPASGGWSERHVVEFEATTRGDYQVVIQATDGGVIGRLALANLQLEAAPQGVMATDYQSTGATREVVETGCMVGNDVAFQNAFDYRCAGGSCFYELAEPVVIDTPLLTYGDSRLDGKLARGNFNFRHMDVVLNAVGYGLLDCAYDSRPSCQASAYIEYDLVHIANNVPIVSSHDERNFNFGTGSVRHGKGLAAERYLTIPLGPTDSQLTSQTQFVKRELWGRPLSGLYKLRIYDQPALRWDRLEDIQLLLSYRYWAPVHRGVAN